MKQMNVFVSHFAILLVHELVFIILTSLDTNNQSKLINLVIKHKSTLVISTIHDLWKIFDLYYHYLYFLKIIL